MSFFASTDAWLVFGRTADVLTVIAALIAIAGIASAWLSRPRLSITVDSDSSLRVHVRHVTGAAPARNLAYRQVMLNDGGEPHAGDGFIPWASALAMGEFKLLEFFDPASHFYSSPPRDFETRMPLPAGHGVVLMIEWQRHMAPWLRTSRVVVWNPKGTLGAHKPVLLKGRKGRAIYARAYRHEYGTPWSL